MTARIETTFDILPILGVVLITAGIIKQYLYYKVFKLRVLSFLAIDEIIISFADNLLSYFVVFILSIIFTVCFFINIDFYQGSVTSLASQSFGNRLLEYLQMNWVLLVFICLINLGVAILPRFRRNIYQYETVLNIIFCWIFFLVLPIILVEIQIEGDGLNSLGGSLYLIVAIVSLITYSIATAYSEAYKVKKKEYFKGSEFEMEDKIILSDSSFFYIGHCKKYMFFYDAANSASVVFPIEKVIKFKFVR